MKLTTQKLGKQFNGAEYFKYRVRPQVVLPDFSPRYLKAAKTFEEFNQLRNWCWEQWGPSCEDHMYGIADNLNLHWAWRLEIATNRPYIYLANDAELAFLTLAWS